MSCFPCVIRPRLPTGETRFAWGEPLVDFYLEFVAGRARPNPLRSVAFDLKTLFVVAEKCPVEVVAADIFELCISPTPSSMKLMSTCSMNDRTRHLSGSGIRHHEGLGARPGAQRRRSRDHLPQRTTMCWLGAGHLSPASPHLHHPIAAPPGRIARPPQGRE